MWHLRLAITAIAVSIASGAQASVVLPYSSLYVFGDSLVDSGNARDASLSMGLPDPAPPAEGYFQGRFSNGPNFADFLSTAITGAPATAFLEGGRNFAVGGALAALVPGETRPSFLSQLGIFSSLGQMIPNDALVLVTFGGNDVRATALSTGTVDFTPTLTSLTSGLYGLVGAGARNIVVTGLPDIGALPSAQALAGIDPTLPGLLTDRSVFLNGAFQSISQTVGMETGADLRFFDLLTFENDVLANPAAYGLPAVLNTSMPCQAAGTGAVLAGCTGYLYFDGIHPTTQIQQAIAGGVAAVAAVPEPETWVMLILGFALLGGVLRRNRASRHAAMLVT